MTSQWWSISDGGDLCLRLEPEEVRTVLGAVNDLRSILFDAADDPITERLFPRAYLDPTEEEAETTWRALAGPDLLRERLDRITIVASGLEQLADPASRGKIVVSAESETCWLSVLNDMRLALGSAIGVSGDDDDPDDADPDLDEHSASARYLYQALTYFHGDLIELMLDRIGEAPLGDS